MKRKLIARRRIWIVMRITLIQLLISLVSFQLTLANSAYSQNLTNTKLDLKVENQTLKNTLKIIENTSEAKFVYSVNQIDLNQKISINVKNTLITDILDKLFNPLNVAYSISGYQIVLQKKQIPYNLIENKNLLKKEEDIKVRGKVKDNKGEELVGISILVKGTSIGTMTNINGDFEISVPSKESVLIFSSIGYLPYEQKVGNATQLDITLEIDSKSLEEVVVVGYGVQQKKLITGATIQVKGDDIEKLNTASVLGALQSQSPGVFITQSSGQVGENYNINIRGLGTTSSTEPLYVIDGVPGGNINALNPSDIESIDVLKDAASAAIYGARAANGVLLITTKQGKSGKTQVSYDGYIGFQNAMTNGVRPANAKEYMSLVNQALLTQDPSGDLLYEWEKELPASLLASINNGSWNGTNWLEESMIKNAPVTSHSFNLTGGSELSKFSMGLSRLNQTGTIGYPATPEYNRITARMNSKHALWKQNDREIIAFGENIVYSDYDKKGVQIGRMYNNNVRDLLKMTPLLPAYNEQGDYYIYKDMVENQWMFDQGLNNPLALLDYTRKNRTSITRRLQSNAFLEVSPIRNLTLRSSVGYILEHNSARSYVPDYILSAKTSNPTDDVTQAQSWNSRWSLENTINYNFSINQNRFESLIGQSVEKWGYGEGLEAKNSFSLFPGSFDHAYLDNTQGLSTTNSFLNGGPNISGSIASFFGRINYNHTERYLASIIMRADGSSNFARGNRWGYFPSVSAGWIISEEDWWNGNKKGINFLKLRGSWGQNGNANIDNFQYLATIAFNTFGYYFDDKNTPSTAAYPDLLANKDVTWETSEQLDLGFDSRLLNSKLSVNFDWYKKTTKNWLVVAPTLLVYGAGAPFINGGDVQNTGLELALNWRDNIGKQLTYGVSLNLAHNKNNVLRLANSEGIIHGPSSVIGENTTESYRVEVGYPMGYFWGYKTLGVFQNQSQIEKWLAEGNAVRQDTPKPGDLIFYDTNGDGIINASDKTMIGNPHPDFTGSLSFNIGYKGFDLSFTAYGAFGMQILKSYRSFSDAPNDNYTNKDLTKYWTGEGSTNKYPSFSYGKHINFIDISDVYIEDADFVKFSNVTLGYDFKKSFRNLPIKRLRLYATGQNLLTLTRYPGMDPEIGFGGERSWASGIDNGYYPSSRTLMIGMNITF